MKSFARAATAGFAALLFLFPRTTIAEAVDESERMGEWEEEGQRFGAIVVKGELVASANAPGGWTLLRTYENKSDERAEITVEERVMETESMWGARVTPTPTVALGRTQHLTLAAHEKKSIGVYLPEKLGASITKGHHTQQWAQKQMAEGAGDGGRTYHTYGVSYLRPLAPGETAAKRPKPGDEDYMEPVARPARMEEGPRVRRAAMIDESEEAPRPKAKAKQDGVL